ncbi:hypothetical protein KP509_26G037000 [Ceratopteris richardii]|uniref:Uncharacterized protein n=1 Tax=Ceratopteris richardii TaxID=49495 RepID=A0A8T2RMS4_CERRI|nr:hypothetical protein KP509_26G037000 [Ceratopteris richardii]
MEIPPIPKVVLGNLLSNVGTPFEFKESASVFPQHNGFRQLPVPLFNGNLRSPAASAGLMSSYSPASHLPSQSGGGHTGDIATNTTHISQDRFLPVADRGPGLPPMKDKPKRVRKGRTETLSGKKSSFDAILDSNAEGDRPSLQLPSSKHRKLGGKVPAYEEHFERSPVQKCSRSKAKVKDPSFIGQLDPTTSQGIMGTYGLPSTFDFSRYISNVSNETWLPNDINMLPFSGKLDPPLSAGILDSSFGTHVGSMLQNIARPLSTDQARSLPVASKLMKSKPKKLSLDLEASPIDESGEYAQDGFLDPMIKTLPNGPYESISELRKAHEDSSHFHYDSIALAPLDLWNRFDSQSNNSLSSLLAQAASAADNSSCNLDIGLNCEQSVGLPPSSFSIVSPHMPQQCSVERLASNSRLNQWLKPRPLRWDMQHEAQPQHGFEKKSQFLSKLDVESVSSAMQSENCCMPAGCLDLDLNKQSLEAEAAEEFVARSQVVGISESQVFNNVPVFIQSQIVQANGKDGEPQCPQTSVSVNASALNRPEDQSNTEFDYTSEIHLASQTKDQQKPDWAIVNKQQEIKQTKGFHQKQQDIKQIQDFVDMCDVEPTKDAFINPPSSLAILTVPNVHENMEWDSIDTSYSPRMQAVAHLLCKMANSSMLFFSKEDDDDCNLQSFCDDSSGPAAKASKNAFVTEKDIHLKRHSGANENQNKDDSYLKGQKDAKEKSLFNRMSTCNNGSVEPWACTPPRHAQRNVVNHISGSQSSESGHSHCQGFKEYERHDELKKPNKTRKKKHAGNGTSNVLTFTGLDYQETSKPLSRTSYSQSLHRKGTLASTQKTKSLTNETKFLSEVNWDGLIKVSRPRTNKGKNHVQSQKGTNVCSVQIGCSIRTPHTHQVLGEVRHDPKL